MKKNYVVALLFVFSGVVRSQEQYRESISYGYDGYIQNSVHRPFVRKIPGGGVINVIYDGLEWSQNLERKNALEHACRIWEEQLPTAAPINIKVKFENLGRNALAKTRNMRDQSINKYRSVIKRQMLFDVTLDFDDDFLLKNDAEISFSDKDVFSYSLNDVQGDRYDFVTVVLRELVKVFGVNSSFLANPIDKYLIYSNENLNEFEHLLLSGIQNKYDAYNCATSNNHYLNLFNTNKSYKVYAPLVFRDMVSFCYLDKDPSNSETILLQPDLPKGTSIRHIGVAAMDILQDIGWARPIPVGMGGGSTDAEPASTNNIIPYNSPSSFITTTSPNIQKEIGYSTQKEKDVNDFESIYDYISQFKDYPIVNIDRDDPRRGWAYCILRKDGTWEVVQKDIPFWDAPFQLNVSNINPNKATEYARTCDGYLRVRKSFYNGRLGSVGSEQEHSFMAYYVLDYLPQKPDLAFSKTLPQTRALNEDYLADIKIDFKNVEGTERILVQQFEEGEKLPSSYYIDRNDVMGGSFVATVDKDFTTKFRLIAQNKNGETYSDMITIPPLNQTKYIVNTKVEDNVLSLVFTDTKGNMAQEKQAIVGVLTSLTNQGISSKLFFENNKISITHLPKGLYAVQVYDKEHKMYAIKFVKM